MARRIQVGRGKKTLADATTEAAIQDAVSRATADLEQEHERAMEVLRGQAMADVEAAREEADLEGYRRGERDALENYDAMLNDSIAERLCNTEELMPWPVGVVIAGEQHRILQTLADIDERAADTLRRRLGIPYIPRYIDAPDAADDTEAPPAFTHAEPGVAPDAAILPGFSPFWKYYLRQLDTD
jgi:hypothetical protein